MTETIQLAAPWSFVTPQTTVDFTAGTHEVSEEIAAAYEAFTNPPAEELPGDTEEASDGDGDPANGAPSAPDQAEGGRRTRRARAESSDQPA